MNNNKYLKKLHRDILIIMDAIHLYCKQNKINYYLVGGTLLGSVRHLGFIPWDDDLDIAMPREDYNIFLKDFDSKSDLFDLLTITNDKTYEHGFAKVVLKNTFFKEEGAMEWPIFVDIFPLDETNGNIANITTTKNVYNKLHGMWVRKNKLYPLSTKTIISKIFGYKKYEDLLKHTISKDNNKGYKYYTNYLSQYSAERQTMPKDWYGDGVEVEFEGRKYIAPVEYKKFLNQLYGPNYMDIPPAEKRRTHYPLYVKFSDGEEIYFDTPEKRISIEETLQ